MMITALKKTVATKAGKRNLLLMVLSMVVLLAMSGLDFGRMTFVVFMIPAFATVFFGDQFVKIATRFMQEEVDKKDEKR